MSPARIARLLIVALIGVALIGVASLVTPARADDPGEGTPMPLGTYTVTAFADKGCPAGFTCQSFAVTCPGVLTLSKGWLAVGLPTGTFRGVVVMLSGAGSTSYWSTRTTLTAEATTDLRAAGLEIVQVRFRKRLLGSSRGELAGPAALSCRYSTVLQHIHDAIYLPAGGTNGGVPGRCGFCMFGASGSSTPVAYSLTHYGQEDIVDGAFPISGPVHGDMTKSCLRTPGDEEYWIGESATDIDASYGYNRGTGPCYLHDSSFTSSWDRDSVATNGNDYYYPASRVHFIFGQKDNTGAVANGLEVLERMTHDAAPMASSEIVPGMGHGMDTDPNGTAALFAALTA